MANLEFNLFRAKFIKGKQLPLEFQDMTPKQVLKDVIFEKPSFEFREGYQWHIGNVEEINDDSGYFAVGRTTTSILAKFDEKTKNFVEETYDASPYTHVIYDTSIGLLAIARKSRLAPTPYGIAKKVEKMLELTQLIQSSGIVVDIDIIRDPKDFLTKIRRAYAIKKYAASFGGPNPFDADEYFQKPMSIYLKEANGKKGKTIIEGDDLDHSVVEKVTVAIAATGNDASARIQTNAGRSAVTIHLGQDTVKVNIPEQRFRKEEAAAKILEAYQGVRNL
jgi:hypothetical protein